MMIMITNDKGTERGAGGSGNGVEDRGQGSVEMGQVTGDRGPKSYPLMTAGVGDISIPVFRTADLYNFQ